LNGDSKNIDDIFEVAQLRVILHDTGAMAGMTGEARRLQASRVCYHVLGIVHAMWPPVPGNMKDYIATPKLNGYKALHTVILPISPDDANPTGGIEETPVFPMEIMIRTEAMHILAENGIAADAEIRQQWRAGARRTSRALRARRRAELRYAASQEGRDVDLKALEREEALDMAAAAADKGTEENVDASLRQVAWLKNIQSWQKEFIDVLSAREFVDTITSDLLGRRVFVFTPKGQVTNLPHGATVVDYAFYTGETGMLMEYAKVNGVQVEFDHVLTNAEVVEIFNEGKELPAHVMLRRLRKLRLNASTRSARAKIQKQLARLGSGDIKELRESLQVEALTLCGESIPDNLGPGPRTVTYCAYMFELVAADRTGLLATVSAAITKSGANIDSYTGVKVADDCFKMSFAIHFDDNELRNGASLKSLDENLSRLFTEVTSFKGVASGSLYCDVDAAVRAAGQE
jgi:(p)ppGpp synthase/HD superfamily hydrolase